MLRQKKVQTTPQFVEVCDFCGGDLAEKCRVPGNALSMWQHVKEKLFGHNVVMNGAENRCAHVYCYDLALGLWKRTL